MRVTPIRLAVAALAATIFCATPVWAGARADVAAVWVPKHLQFIYQGFTTHYSCDGLRDEVVRLLSKLGPRDLKVREEPCVNPVGITPFPGVRVRMQVLVPAAKAAKPSRTAPVVRAHWQRVVLMPSNAGLQQQGNCELLAQFKAKLLPLFTARKIDYASTCVPYQVNLGTHLSAEVLMPARRGKD